MTRFLVLALALPLVASGCDDDPEIAEGIFADLGEVMPSATDEERATFARGRDVALRRFAPAEGLGPQFNLVFCAGCHEKPVFGGSAGRYRNFLLVGQRLSDGSFTPTGVNGVQPQFGVNTPRIETAEGTNVVATRNPIPFFGVGLLAEISDEEILSRQDPDDADGDGISGRANFDRGFVGRFGRKSQSVAIESFIRGPLFNHLGITTDPLSAESRGRLPVPGADSPRTVRAAITGDIVAVRQAQAGAPDEPTEDQDGVADPELAEDDLFDLIAFSMLMAAPRPDEPTPESEAGRQLFDDIGCIGCHVAALRGPRGLIPAYTDLLVHDMGPELADGTPQGIATGSEFRTAPLWGVDAVAPYLHDGRADTLDEAIRWHGGEAEASADAYAALSEADRGLVIAFLQSLGGRSQRSDGLVPPNAPVRPTGEFGGPIADLDSDETALFVRGRAVFDFDRSLVEGLGPRFNGDACRACHFDPVIGGSGPSDVDVIQQGIYDALSGEFTVPDTGPLAHRFAAASDERPAVVAAVNIFERRQTPAIFGLGLIDQIPDEVILANADPDDANDDGISGRANVLDDQRLGRLGWKANVPSLAEFSRDALANELGLTLPDQPGLTFGFATDADDVADPEIAVGDIEALTFYMAQLAPPPRVSTRPELEDEGEAVFAAVGCDGCHTPSLQTAGGADVALYSDLLLHDVAPLVFEGIEAGEATMREFRTPPLWGLGSTAPYMHNGSAATIEEAILAHAAEAEASRELYSDLPDAMKQALLAFLESL